jgi:hypothetical protein
MFCDKIEIKHNYWRAVWTGGVEEFIQKSLYFARISKHMLKVGSVYHSIFYLSKFRCDLSFKVPFSFIQIISILLNTLNHQSHQISKGENQYLLLNLEDSIPVG